MKELKIKILECHHKKENISSYEGIHLPIHVGKAISNEILDMIGDDTGDNISNKNKIYCELTAMYWAWKNLGKIDYIGLCHYRRHFNLQKIDINDILKRYDIVLIKPDASPFSNMLRLTDGTTREDAYILINVIYTFFPDYKGAVVNYLFNSNKWIPYNMLLTSEIHFKNYSKWLFEVLSIVEVQLKWSEYSRLKRILGYMGEVLLGIYCTAKNLKIKYVNLLEDNYNTKKRLLLFRNELSFKLNNPCKINNIYIPDSTIEGFRNDKITINPELQKKI